MEDQWKYNCDLSNHEFVWHNISIYAEWKFKFSTKYENHELHITIFPLCHTVPRFRMFCVFSWHTSPLTLFNMRLTLEDLCFFLIDLCIFDKCNHSSRMDIIAICSFDSSRLQISQMPVSPIWHHLVKICLAPGTRHKYIFHRIWAILEERPYSPVCKANVYLQWRNETRLCQSLWCGGS